MQEAITVTAETVCCAAQKNDQLISAVFLSAAHFMHSKTEADLQVVI